MDRYLILENGKIFKGKAFGAEGEVIAEIVFTTAMTGYFETLTDKSYEGQMVVQTFPLIGNYGIIPEDAEGGIIAPKGYIVREQCEAPSNFRCEMTLDELLKRRGIPGIYGIDTRALTRIIRESGVMNAMIADNPENADFEKIRSYKIENPVRRVTTKDTYEVTPEYMKKVTEKIAEESAFTMTETGDAAKSTIAGVRMDAKKSYKVAMLDFGLKDNIARCLAARGCDVNVLPAQTEPVRIKEMNPDGIFLSNGPGDPTDNTEIIENLKELSGYGIPIMGICLGHQLLALSHGFSTHKLKYGHRGANQPVKDMINGITYISTQNHGYAVTNESIDENVASVYFENVNDGTNEGLIYKNEPAFSVQFHPEACGGPKDTEFLFDKFIDMMEENV